MVSKTLSCRIAGSCSASHLPCLGLSASSADFGRTGTARVASSRRTVGAWLGSCLPSAKDLDGSHHGVGSIAAVP